MFTCLYIKEESITDTKKAYQVIVDNLRAMMEAETDAAVKEDIEENIIIYENIIESSERSRFKIIDVGLFNSIIEGYLLLTLDHIARDAEEGRDEDNISDTEEARAEADRIRRRAPGALRRMLDDYGAQRAEEYSFSNTYTRGRV